MTLEPVSEAAPLVPILSPPQPFGELSPSSEVELGLDYCLNPCC